MTCTINTNIHYLAFFLWMNCKTLAAKETAKAMNNTVSSVPKTVVVSELLSSENFLEIQVAEFSKS